MIARRHSVPGALVSALAVLSIGPANASALKFTPCSESAQFRCATLTVPLDHSGNEPGEIELRVAAQRRYPKRAGLLVALAGGPGQAGVPFADQFAAALAPMLRGNRLIVIDQRGTGREGALSCPSLQRSKTYTPSLVGDCAKRIGLRRRFFSSLDSAADLEAVRRAFNAPKLAIMGVSYGTWVAQEYARQYPTKIDSMVLDSVVGPQQPSGFYLDSLAALPRVTADQCAGGRCSGITKDAFADLTAVVQLAAEKPLRGQTYDARGRARSARLSGESAVWNVVSAADLNADLQAELPAAMSAARGGDYAQLLRLVPIATGRAPLTRELSLGLNAITSCLDADLPYQLSTATAARSALMAAALAAIPSANYRPFSASTIGAASAVSDCLLFPTQFDTSPAAGRLPNVRALVLAGRLDLRTPAENAAAVTAQMPKAELIELAGAGHDLLGGDTTGCIATALKRFAAKQRVGSPCARRNNAVRPVGVAPLRVANAQPARGVGGGRGRALTATLGAVGDAISVAYMKLSSGELAQGGGLRGGSFDGRSGPMSGLRLKGYRYAGDLAVSGNLSLFSSGPRGRVNLIGAANGHLTINSWNSASGVIDGRAVSWQPAAATTARRPSGRRAGPLLR